MNKRMNLVIAALASTLLLAACGGGNDSNDIVFEDADPTQSDQSGSVTVAGSTSAARNGVYASANVFLNAVEKRNPIGSDPELCRYRFNRLDQAADNLVMSGDIRYQPGTNTVRVMFISIYNDNRSVEYSLTEPTGATVDRTNDEVDFAAAMFRSQRGETITLTGSIPMRDDRPEGC